MEPNWQSAVQVVMNGHPHGQTHRSNGPSHSSSRPLSVDEALQYSPMSSAPVFGLDCILRPDIGRPSNTTSMKHILQSGRNSLNELNNLIQSGRDESGRLDTSREYLQQLLDSEQLTEFKFKAPSGTAATRPTNSDISASSVSNNNELGSFAKMMLDSTNVAFTSSDQRLKKDLKGPPPKLAAYNERAHNANKSRTASHNENHTSSQVSVVIPVKPFPTDAYDHVHLKRRKLNTDGDTLTSHRLKDQKEEADAALMRLQDLLHEIFEAEDQLEPGTEPGVLPQLSNALFVHSNTLELAGPLLSSEYHRRFQREARKVLDFGRLQDIPSDYLNRIQKLCEKPIIAAQTSDLKLEDSSNESETDAWAKKSEDMLNALLAIGTLLLTMSHRQAERDLCPADLLDAIPTVVSRIFDNCIIPAVQARPAGKDAGLFEFFTSQKRIIAGLIQQSKKVLALLADFISRIDVSEGMINATEYFSSNLIFVENPHTEKDSAVGHQKYEPVRRAGMDVLAKIFSKYPVQRPYILNDILGSLEKLPSTRQSARQFKIADGKNIQLLSALLMQLVQTTALDTPTSRSTKAKRKLSAPADDGEDNNSGDQADSDDDDDSEASLDRLRQKVKRLHDNTARSATYIIKFIVERAMSSSKTGDEPYRNILDLFTEDLINVLGSTDWPAAELLLRIMALHLVGIANDDKSAAIAKSMALELLGWMGSAISDLIVNAQHLLPAMEEYDGDLTDYLRQLFDDYSSRALHPQDIIVPRGPYRITLEYLLRGRDTDNWSLSSARDYYLLQWAKAVWPTEDSDEQDAVDDELVVVLSKLFADPLWLEAHREYEDISVHHGKFSYILTVLNSSFCKAFKTILNVLLNSIGSDQAKVRSRSLKSVIYMLEKDPNLLDRDVSVMRVILRCATDASPMVRDSALSLIAKCMALKPNLEEDGCRSILACSADPAVGVRKRCIGLLKDIYLKTSRTELKLGILDSFLQRTGDIEESVATLARQTIEEIWLSPFHDSIDSPQDGPKLKVALGEQVSLLVSLVRRSETTQEALGACLKKVLSASSKSASQNFKVCKAMVSTMFEKLVEDTDSGKDYQQALLWTITVFAKANAKLFSPDQLKTLHPYVGNLSTTDDLFIFRSVVMIYRRVLPYLTSAHDAFLKEVQNDLLKTVSRLARSELNEVMACLWTINGVLKNTERLVRLAISVLDPIQRFKSVNLADSANAQSLAKAKCYIRIAGCVGRHCDLEKFEPNFKKAFPSWKGGSVAGLMVDTILPFTLPRQPRELRFMALESLGSICQSWPGQFCREGPIKVLSLVFDQDNPGLQNVVLRSFAEFFEMHEGKTEKAMQPAAEVMDQENSTRLGGSLKASDHDGAAVLIAQNFLRNMVRVAQSRQDSFTLTAIELISSINRQGLVHPKECAGVLVSLETSTVPAIAKIAFDTHKMLHQQHESIIEKEYTRAVQEAFNYQRGVVGDPNGATGRPYVAKLAPLFEIIKISNSRYQRKFLENLCSRVKFELRKLDLTGNPPEHLLLSRFICHNLAFVEYGQLTELVPTIACMERIVADVGTPVAHLIETELFPVKIEAPEGMDAAPTVDQSIHMAPPQPMNPGSLRLLATAAATLSMLWETRTYLRRLYAVSGHVRHKERKVPKEYNKSATKVHGVTGDKYWDAIARNMAALDCEENMINKCREFATLLAIDDEFKVGDTDDLDDDSLDAPGEVEHRGTGPGVTGGQRPKKRKSSVSGSNTPKKPRGRKPGPGKKRTSTESDDEMDVDWM